MDSKPAPRAERRRLSHVDRTGRPRMVDVSDKASTARRAVAEATVAVSQETMSLVIDGGGTKGDVLGVAELAGVMGGKLGSCGGSIGESTLLVMSIQKCPCARSNPTSGRSKR